MALATTTPPADPPLIDPLAALLGARTRFAPTPLAGTRLSVTLAAGLAVVETTRLFRNAEALPIEATITFPVPIHAVLFRLAARIGDRTLEGRAQRRTQARATYEGALDRGKAAVLHEQLLPGIHMLSAGQVPPGAEIEVRFAWAMPMAVDNGTARLRIPMTVGDIYGREPLPDSDALVHGGPAGTARLALRCLDGTATLGGQPVGTEADVPLNRPVDLALTGWSPRLLAGRSASGMPVGLRITPLPAAPARRDLAILVDRSGSMNGACDMHRPGLSRHAAVRQALAAFAPALAAEDAVELWEFSTAPRCVGHTRHGPGAPAAAFAHLVGALAPVDGGTEIGNAVAAVLASSEARDILLLTDGNSHALNVPGLVRAASGRRISLVLVGEDSLEARVGHLAAQTGGEIAIAGSDVAEALGAALRALDAARAAAPPDAVAVRGQAAIALTRPEDAATEDDPLLARAVAAVAASLQLAALPAQQAAALAEAEGLVTTETSLVLVDEAGTAHVGISATRKIALPTPARREAMFPFDNISPSAAPKRAPAILFDAPDLHAAAEWHPFDAPERVLPRELHVRIFALLPFPVTWSKAPAALEQGDLSTLSAHLRGELQALADTEALQDLARRFGIAPLRLALGLLAATRAGIDRTAERLARAILPKELLAELDLAL